MSGKQSTNERPPHARALSDATRRRRRVAIALIAGVIFGVVGGLGVAMVSGPEAIEDLKSYEAMAATRFFDRNGDVVATIYVEQRIPIPLSDVPEELKRAIVAVEDQAFYDHHGVHASGIAKAMLRNVFKGRMAAGGSTITQQLAKNLFLTPEKTLRRKLREAYLAFQIEQHYTKDQILEMYLNQIFLGNGAFGVEAASQIYFGKHAKDLELVESALLAGLPKAPSFYDPVKHPERAKLRRNVALFRLADAGVISQQEFERLKEKPLEVETKKKATNAAPYFIDYILPQLEARFGGQQVWRGGLQVYTTLDLGMQKAARTALDRGLQTARDRQTSYERRRKRTVTDPVEGALLALDPQTGDVLAMVGGSNYKKTQFNRAVQAKRQPGSTFKPLVYAAAINAGYTQSDSLWDAPLRYKNRATGKVWAPKNWYHNNKNYDPFLGKIPMRKSMEVSSNCASVYLLERLGLPTAIQTARRLGITTPMDSNLTLALGASDVTVVDLTRAYAAIANGGVSTEPRAVVRVLDLNGGALYTAPPSSGTVALSPDVAYVVTDMLHGYTTTGLAKSAGTILPFDVAGKTGTTDSSYDAWFVGFNTRVVAAVWMGTDKRQPMRFNMSGSTGPLPVWIEFMKTAGKRDVPAPFQRTAGVSLVEVDRRTGRLADKSCEGLELDTWAFLSGTEPTESCTTAATTTLPFGFDLGGRFDGDAD